MSDNNTSPAVSGSGRGNPAFHATVFRRGGHLIPSHRHGSQRTKRWEAMGPKPRWWMAISTGPAGSLPIDSCSPIKCRDEVR